MIKPKRTAEQRIADDAERRALHSLASRQKISDSQAEPEFEQNHKRLRADRLAARLGSEGEMKSSSRCGRWTPEEDDLLRKLAVQNGSPFDIAMQLKRSLASVRARAHRLGIPLGFVLRPAAD
jgi:hypothetical protein